MAVSKTKALLVDVARQLFAKNGLEETTMNDIAVASQKGRRTLYTYFKNKEEIYSAVIESELSRMTEHLTSVSDRDIDPEEKIIELIYARLGAIKEIVYRNGNLRAEFFRDVWMVETARKAFDKAQIELYRKVLYEGRMKGTFQIENVELLANIIHYCVKGLEVPYIKGTVASGVNPESRKPLVAKLVLRALGKDVDI